jgi:site-specific DNA recombinase
MKPTKTIEYKKALIYCRVSSVSQKNDGHGLESQAYRCQQYASLKEYEVEEVFRDDYSGGGDFMKRPAMAKLLKYLDTHSRTKYVVIFDDLKRFARDTEFHIRLRQALDDRGVRPECLNFNFEDTPSGKFMETISAAHNQMEREENKDRVYKNMKARLESGYWPFNPPPGLKNLKDDQGKIIEYLVPDQPVADILKEAIEGYAEFKLSTHENVRQFILNKYSERGIKRSLSLSGVKRMLTNVIYAGHIEYEPWGIKLMKGHHNGIISWEMFQKVQDRLNSVGRPRLRKDYSEDFPLRNFILCPECRKPCTAGWFKGKAGKRFPYYLCKQIDCSNPQKMIQRLELDKSFSKLVKDLKPKPKTTEMVHKFLLDVWGHRQEIEIGDKAGIAKEIANIDLKVADFMDLIGEAKSPLVVKQYELKVEKLLQEKEDLEQNMQKQNYSENNFAHIQEVVVKHLENPANMWQTKEFRRKRLLLNMYFTRGVVYNKKSGFQTPDLPLIVTVLTQKHTTKNHLVEMARVKLASKTNSLFNWSQD